MVAKTVDANNNFNSFDNAAIFIEFFFGKFS